MKHNELTFICHIAPERFLESIPDLSNAAFLFQHKVIKSLQPSTIVSILPLPCIGKKTENDKKIKYFNGRQSKLKLIKLFYDLIDTLRIIPKNQINLYYNLNVQTFLVLFLSKYLKNSKNFVIIADFESSSNYNNLFRKLLQKVINLTYSLCDGVIVLSDNIKIHKNSIYFAALVDEESLIKTNDILIEKKSILFSGSINESYGIEMAVKAMENLKDYHLYITGRLINYSEEDFFKLLSTNKNNNIKFLGNIGISEYIELLNKVEFALSLREENEHKYNFPSKVVEYLSYNKKVISTMKYSTLEDTSYIFSEFSPFALSEVIKKNSSLGQPNHRKYVINKFSLEAFKKSFIKLTTDNNDIKS